MIERLTEDTEQLPWIPEWDEKAWLFRVSYSVLNVLTWININSMLINVLAVGLNGNYESIISLDGRPSGRQSRSQVMVLFCWFIFVKCLSNLFQANCKEI